MIRAFWCLSPNFGDALTPWLIEKITGRPAAHVSTEIPAKHYLVAGSILNHCRSQSIAWGPGIATITDPVPNALQIRAVRGPISRARAASCGAWGSIACGDPGLLLPRLYSPKGTDRVRLAFAPHYVDYALALEVLGGREGLRVVNMLDPIEKVIDDICAADLVLSSSLHGMVVAAAYGVPFDWVATWNQIGGDGTKFRDFGLSVGIDMFDPLRPDPKQVPVTEARSWRPRVNTDALWESCPFEVNV